MDFDLGQMVGFVADPLNISGYGGIPGVNSDGRSIGDLGKDIKGDLTGSKAMEDAIAAQKEGAAQATATLGQVYGLQNQTLAPYLNAGQSGLTGLQNKDIVGNFQGDPGYQFRLNEGNKAINNSAAARGLGNSGATLKALTRYGQDYASGEYDKAYGREFNRLSTLAGIGTNASTNSVNAAGNYGNAIAGIQTGMANANASARMAQANQQNQLIGQGIQGGAMILSSDERLKTDINPIPKEQLSEMKSFLKAFYFKYKDQIRGEGTWPGIIAQDLEKSELGRTLVVEDEKGFKCVDIKKLMSMFLATMAEA